MPPDARLSQAPLCLGRRKGSFALTQHAPGGDAPHMVLVDSFTSDFQELANIGLWTLCGF